MTVDRRLTALNNLFALSKDVGQALTNHMASEINPSTAEMTGSELEQHIWLGRLAQVAAYAIPEAGDERTLDRTSYPILKQLRDDLKNSNFPMCIFETQYRHKNTTPPHLDVMDDAKRTMGLGRQTAESAMRIALRHGPKQRVFDWLGQIARANVLMSTLARPELLTVDGIAVTCASRSFLMGLTSTLVGLCNSNNLRTRFEQHGYNAFDVKYLSVKTNGRELGYGCVGKGDNEHGSPALLSSCMSAAERSTPNKVVPTKFTGATEIFFLTSAFLRVSLYPVMRMKYEFGNAYGNLLEELQGSTTQSLAKLERAIPVVAAYLGFPALLEAHSLPPCYIIIIWPTVNGL